MKQETLTAAAMQTDDDGSTSELLNLIVVLDYIQSRIFCPAPDCGAILDIRRAVQLTPTIGGRAIARVNHVFCGADCTSRAMQRIQDKVIVELSWETLTPGCFKQSFPHVRLREEPDYLDRHRRRCGV